MPEDPETYVHRIGRTGRAGSKGYAFSFCDNDERTSLKEVCKIIGKQIPVTTSHPFVSLESVKVSINSNSIKKDDKKTPKENNRKQHLKRKNQFKRNKSKRVTL
jgi:ATP-dependent RNA helicase RhlE